MFYKIKQFLLRLINNWLWITLPFMLASMVLNVLDGWGVVNTHIGYYTFCIIFVFWLFAPSLLNKFKT